jgi:assimilatory nitrate reductase catalytic subunit
MSTTTRSTCPYCGVGCGVLIESEGARITGVRGDPEHPANFGRLCSKGQALHQSATPEITLQLRALHPMRRAERDGPLTRVGWNEALDEVATRLARTVQEHGPDSVGFYLSGQMLTEDYHVFNKLGKGLVGTNNVDTNSRLCMSSAVAGYKASLGADAVPCSYEDLALADTVFITGSNMAWAHPVLYRRLEDARRARPGMKLVVADPRRTDTAADADLHLQLLPGTDVVLYHALLHVMLWEGLTDPAFIAAHTTGFGPLRDRVREFTPAHAAKVCGLKADDIVTAARWFAGLADDGTRQPTLSLWCQGLNQSTSGTDRNTALINLHLATGQIGKPGAGPFSLTGQPNAMGGREVGGLANLLPGHREVADAQHRAEVAALWGVRELPATPGKSAVDMFAAAAAGDIKALWIVCTNPAQSLPDQTLVRRALERCEFVVVQETFCHAATVRYADVLLPAAGWGEKEGTVTNSERRISRVRAAVPAAGEARADWAIGAAVAKRLESLLPDRRAAGSRSASLFAFDTPEAVWTEHRESTRGRDLDITGLGYAQLESAPAQWPFAEGASVGAPRLYTDHRFATADGRARFHAPAWRATAEQRDAHYPLSLTTGRLRDQWHGMTRSGTAPHLFAHAPAPALEMHPQEIERRKWKAGDLVRVRSRRGTLVLPVQPSDSVPPALAHVAMHWGEEWLGGEFGRGVNVLMSGATCPQSRQPELKHAAVRVERAELPWALQVVAWMPAGEALARRETLHRWLGAFAYAHCVPFGARGAADAAATVGLHLRAAAAAAPPAELIDRIAALFGLAEGRLLHYADARAGRRRIVRLDAAGALAGFLLAGDDAAEPWMTAWLRDRRAAAGEARALLSGAARAPVATPPASPVVCSCHGVTEAAISAACASEALAALDGAERLAALQQRLRCGTECGSCLPAVKALARRAPVQEVAV